MFSNQSGDLWRRAAKNVYWQYPVYDDFAPSFLMEAGNTGLQAYIPAETYNSDRSGGL